MPRETDRPGVSSCLGCRLDELLQLVRFSAVTLPREFWERRAATGDGFSKLILSAGG